MPTSNPRFTVSIPQELYDEIEQFHHQNMYKSQNSAILDLIRQGVDHLSAESQKEKAPAPMERELAEDEQRLIAAYRKVEPSVQAVALDMMEGIVAAYCQHPVRNVSLDEMPEKYRAACRETDATS